MTRWRKPKAELEALAPDARVRVMVADNKDHAAAAAAVARAVDRFGRLDIINNAHEFRTGIPI